MAEYFAEISPDCQFFKDWYKYFKNQETLRLLVNNFFKEKDIESNHFIANQFELAIIPTDRDRENFRTELRKNPFSDNNQVYGFKKRSNTYKDFCQMLIDNDFKFTYQPRIPNFYKAYTLVTLEEENRLLLNYQINDITETKPIFDPEFAKFLTDISGSTYYTAMEEYQERKKKRS